MYRHGKLSYFISLSGLWLAVFFLTRCLLLAGHYSQIDPGLFEVLQIFGTGFVYDLCFLVYAALPLALYLAVVPARIWSALWHQRLVLTLSAISMFVMFFTATAEWLFWGEFGSRFNFIAVDYLVYSQEVVNNILESYPVYPLLAFLVVLAMAGTALLHHKVDIFAVVPRFSGRFTSICLGGWALVALLITWGVNGETLRAAGGNTGQRELAASGPFQFFSAFRNNELDYAQFYATLPVEDAGPLLRREVAETNVRFVNTDLFDVRRTVDNPGDFRPLNIVLVTVESLSAKYLGSNGNKESLTPNLDQLRGQSLYFTNFYATGTRTDRGLEAITLSVPPTPGRSIVKRLGRESGYASLGRQLGAHGYDSAFLYGGRGYFDNMNAFFSGNGYRVVDQSSVAEQDISFKNAWGMCDEDLYTQALRVADADHAIGKPFFLQLMTTSNHRPYTYPDNRIDIPSGDGREGAVKYTDFAIGRFLAQARVKPWFGKTIFVVVADHTANSAGKEDLPVEKYRIPLFIHAPELLPSREVTILASQIDLAPTLLGLLNFDYESTFFGRNVLREGALPGRVLVGNYQHLGLFDGRNLAILSPRKGLRLHEDALGLSSETLADINAPLLRRDVAYFQGASYAFQHGFMRWQPKDVQ